MQARAKGRIRIAFFTLACLAVGLAVGSTANGAPSQQRNTPRGLAQAKLLGHEDPSLPISVALTLDLRDHAAVDALIAAQQDPASPQYHQWITPEEFRSRFGPLPEDIQAAQHFLEDKGFKSISRLTSTTVVGSGNVGLVERAFGVTINRYEYHGRKVFANTSDPVLPGPLAAKVAHVGGLDNLTRMFPRISAKEMVSPDYLLSGSNYMLGRDSQISYNEKTAYFDAGKKGVPGAELAIASSFDVNLSSLNNILTRQGGGYTSFTSGLTGP